jgi:hypothetical protein
MDSRARPRARGEHDHRASVLQLPGIVRPEPLLDPSIGRAAGQGDLMRTAALTAIIAVALATAGNSAEKARKPRLDLRAAPRMAFSPVNVLLTAELSGGDDVDQYYCPAVEWDWDDGGRSVQESDCPPMEAGGTFERRFTAEHAYNRAGSFNVKMTMRKANRAIAVATTTVTVHAGAGEASMGAGPD